MIGTITETIPEDASASTVNIEFNIDNPNYSLAWDYLTNSIKYLEVPQYISLAHELIHAKRDIDGNDKSSIQTVIKYYDIDGNLRQMNCNAEECEVSGLDYTEALFYDTPEGGQITLEGNNVSPNSWVTSENSIRREHYLGDRIKY